jgi:hypothetical protein
MNISTNEEKNLKNKGVLGMYTVSTEVAFSLYDKMSYTQYMRSEAFTNMNIKIIFFWDMLHAVWYIDIAI